jgi:hypothetical protein
MRDAPPRDRCAQAARPGAPAGNCHFELRIFLEVVEKALSSLLALPGRPA